MSSRPFDRRAFLQRTGALAAGAVIYPRLAGPASAEAPAGAAAAAVTELPVPASWQVRPFGNDRVALAPGLFADKRERILNFLRGYPVDTMLYNFRVNAGLPTNGATRGPGAWEDPTGNLRGHYTGHYLSALALAYAGTGDAVYQNKLAALVAGLGECRNALAATAAAPTPRVAGRFGSAVRLSGCPTGNVGDCDSLSLPVGVVRGLTDFTIATWVKLGERSTSSRVFDFGTDADTHMYLSVHESTGGPRFGITTRGAAGEQRINATAPLPTGSWVHVAVTLSRTTGTLYVNGSAVASNTAMTLRPADLGTTTVNRIGRGQFPQRSVQWLQADLSDFQVYSRALSTVDIQALVASADAGLAGKVAWYRFAEAGGRDALDSSGRGQHATVVGPNDGQRHPGFLAAYRESQFIRLEEYCTYSGSGIWAPWYTTHMIMRGLLDASQLAGNAQARELVLGMADWAVSRLGRLTRPQLDTMWGIYIAGEYNAMNDLMTDLHALTGNANYLTAAKAFDNTVLLDATVADVDILGPSGTPPSGRHANQHIPQFIGYLNLFDRGGEQKYLTAAANFWNMVVGHRTYIDGGIAGVGEYFGERDVIAGTMPPNQAETCPVYNMLKLSRQLFFHTADPKYMQYYERALYGQILASRRDTDSTSNPLLTYFVAMAPGVVRGYGNLGTCCGGTGLESHAKFQDSIYFRSVDDSTLYVNLYLASTLRWAEKGFTVTQATDYPTNPAGTVRLTVNGSGPLTLKLRVPYWVRAGYQLRVNGVSAAADAVPGSYVAVSRTWAPGDTVDIAMPFTLRAERALDLQSRQGIAYGPVPMVIKNSATSYLNLGFYRNLGLSGDLARGATPTGAPMTFNTNGFVLAPFFIGDTSPYHGYFTRAEPQIVFGTVDSGVPNRQRAGGLSFLDAVWDGAPFRDQAAFVRAVTTVSADWQAQGLLSRTERQRVMTAASQSTLPA
ncbi:MAG TPA: beta-L-arabinofuranosidase domain-containing protein [Mycobacteriales bacterium]|nr:beta-L-arabinofuranosidase domain-containing protein [Mycobacteriales bacterium]